MIDIASQAYSLQNESIRNDPWTYDDGSTSDIAARLKPNGSPIDALNDAGAV
jgi:hypothetical protein